MEIRIREVVAELLKNPYIDVTYNEIEDGGYYTDSIQEDQEVEKLSCLDTGDIEEYLNGSIGYAIHVGDIELFDVSRDIKSFKHTKVYHKCEECPYGNPCQTCFSCEEVVNLEKAPQSWCYVEDTL